jgi:hypothetical protein
MWTVFAKSFEKNLDLLEVQETDKSTIRRLAKIQYKHIIANLPVFEKGDPFLINILSCAMFAAFLDVLETKPELKAATDYYEAAMMTPIMKFYCRLSAKSKFSKKTIENLRQTAAARYGDVNPYTWNMDFFERKNGYEARFTKCGICTLMKEHGYAHLVPALCHLDYAMNEAGGSCTFLRQYTLAEGGPYCDCAYLKKG